MFEVKRGLTWWYISDRNENFMHRDGDVIHGPPEYWHTREQAQAVLDKYRPPCGRRLEDGDVYENDEGCLVMFVHMLHISLPQVLYLTGPDVGSYEIWSDENNLLFATFLFNIKDKL